MARRKPKPEPNNFQDEAMEKEKMKGERDAGSSSSTSKGNPKDKRTDKNESDSSDHNSGKATVAIYTGAKNPIDMHSFNPAYLEPLGKLTTNLRNGYPELLRLQAPTQVTWSTAKVLNNTQPIGGVFALPFVPTIGETADVTNGINLANVGLFNAVRAATGGTQYYEAPDLGIYNIALVNCYAYYAAMIRIYGIVKNYKYDNVYIPEGILLAHGINYSDIQKNIENFRGWINLFAHKIMQFRLPSGFEYLNRAVWMNSNIYLDSPLTNSQIYEFVQLGFYQLQEGISAHSYQYYYKKQVKSVDYDLWHLKLVAAPWASDGVHVNGVGSSQSAATFAQISEFGEALIRPLVASQDIDYISAGYERAFQSFAEVNPIAETFSIDPVYDESVLMQIENATFLGNVNNLGCTIAEDISVNQGNLVSDLRYLQTSVIVPDLSINTAVQDVVNVWRKAQRMQTEAIQAESIMLNMHDKTQFEPADVMEASRMITFEGDATPLQYDTSDLWYANAPMNAKSIDATTLAQAWTWYQMQTYASQIMLNPFIVAFRFNSYATPWTGVSKFSIQLRGSYDYRLDIADLQTDISNSMGISVVQSQWNQFYTQIANDEYLKDFAITLLSQWDWHPRWVKWMLRANYSNTGTTLATLKSAPSVTYLGQALDVATYAMLGQEQLKELNKYDMTTQFNNPQIGSYAVK